MTQEQAPNLDGKKVSPPGSNARSVITKAMAAERVMGLLAGGASERQVAQILGVQQKTVARIKNEELGALAKRRTANAEQYREQLADQARRMHGRLWYAGGYDKSPFDLNSPPSTAIAGTLLEIMRFQMRLFGLEGPVRVQFDMEFIDDSARTLARVAMQYIPEDKRDEFIVAVRNAMVRGTTQAGLAHGDADPAVIKAIAGKILAAEPEPTLDGAFGEDEMIEVNAPTPAKKAE